MNDLTRASGYAIGYADSDTLTTFAPAVLPLLLLSEPDQPLRSTSTGVGPCISGLS